MIKPRPSRVRRIAKWTGLVVCMLILAAWGTGLGWFVSYQREVCCMNTPVASWGLLLNGGLVRLLGSDTIVPHQGVPVRETRSSWEINTVSQAHRGWRTRTGWFLPRAERIGRTSWDYICPLWLPLLLAGVPTGVL